MLRELIEVVNFDDSGAFIEPPAEPQHSSESNEHGTRRHDSLDSSLGSSNGSGSAASSSSSSAASVPRPEAPPSFEGFLAMPRDFMAAHALHSATEATLLLDIAGLAIEMDTIVECALEQLHDHQQVTRQFAATQTQESQGGASLATTLVVLQCQAAMSNTKTLKMLLQRLQACVDRLSYLRYPLAHCIETNSSSALELVVHDPSAAQSRRLLARAEEILFRRLESLLDPQADFRMTPFVLPRWKPRSHSGAAAQVCWPASSSFMASGNSPYRALDDVRLSSSASSSSSTTQTTSLPPVTPLRERNASLHDDHSHSQSSSKSSSESKQQENGTNSNDSSSSSRLHSQPRM